MIAYLSIPGLYNTERPTALGLLRRYLLTLAIAVALAALTVDRRGMVSEPTPIVMTTTYDPPRFGRARPYRAHRRRGLWA